MDEDCVDEDCVDEVVVSTPFFAKIMTAKSMQNITKSKSATFFMKLSLLFCIGKISVGRK